ncbi:P-loop NTPase family protein [Nonomuraea gerenzanensis]|uniref:DNA topology modulation protein n=1 Tax=Nonomuraea gerenzanensis TaxID=93944 RepID=A0A1M4EK29_9ACTN|nr:topology modulation protein [Nonomuraea gerenzanensis]UBU10808.1 topology modulation protein [Nonomuraea gerenzanensis]SBO99241.1 DNA topology modulation protein [Nonomuraea gerenzanensis]
MNFDAGKPRLTSRNPRRIAIIGCGGSGKTVLANRLGATLNLPVTHLDALYYDDTWTPTPQEEFAQRQRSLVAGESWIIDGNYASTLPIRLAAADTVLFLDLPPVTCLWGIATRRLRHRGGQHARTGAYDRITWDFIRYVYRYRQTMAPRVRGLIAEHAGHATVLVLRSRRAINRWHADLPAQQPNSPHRGSPPEGPAPE